MANPPASSGDDLALDVVFQGVVAGITGLPGSLVRPSFQVVPPVQPGVEVDWCAVHAAVCAPDDNVYEQENETGDGLIQISHEQLEVLTSFYGPNALTYARRLRRGLAVAQNRFALTALCIAFVGTHAIRRVPEQVNKQWIERQDMPITFRRKVVEVYGVMSLQIAGVRLFDDTKAVDKTFPVPPEST